MISSKCGTHYRRIEEVFTTTSPLSQTQPTIGIYKIRKRGESTDNEPEADEAESEDEMCQYRRIRLHSRKMDRIAPRTGLGQDVEEEAKKRTPGQSDHTNEVNLPAIRLGEDHEPVMKATSYPGSASAFGRNDRHQRKEVSMESSSDSPNRPIASVNCYTANQGPRIVGRERDYVWMCSGCGWVNSSWLDFCPNPTCQHVSDNCCDTESWPP